MAAQPRSPRRHFHILVLTAEHWSYVCQVLCLLSDFAVTLNTKAVIHFPVQSITKGMYCAYWKAGNGNMHFGPNTPFERITRVLGSVMIFQLLTIHAGSYQTLPESQTCLTRSSTRVRHKRETCLPKNGGNSWRQYEDAWYFLSFLRFPGLESDKSWTKMLGTDRLMLHYFKYSWMDWRSKFHIGQKCSYKPTNRTKQLRARASWSYGHCCSVALLWRKLRTWKAGILNMTESSAINRE